MQAEFFTGFADCGFFDGFTFFNLSAWNQEVFFILSDAFDQGDPIILNEDHSSTRHGRLLTAENPVR